MFTQNKEKKMTKTKPNKKRNVNDREEKFDQMGKGEKRGEKANGRE